mgnify:CR=1 FL=1
MVLHSADIAGGYRVHSVLARERDYPHVVAAFGHVTQPIKSTGDYTVSVRLHPEVAAKVPVKVVAGA